MKQKKKHWFLVEQSPRPLDSNLFIFTESKLLHQFNRVLKFKQEEQIVLFNGKGKIWECTIKDINKRECLLSITNERQHHSTENKKINLFFAIPKKNKFELIIEKGTEVGISSFNPINTDRTEKEKLNKERVEKILIEAVEQSQNPIIPQVSEVHPIKKVIQKLDTKNTFVFHTEGEQLKIAGLPPFREVNILIGPEGGWSNEELETFKDNGFKIYKLGESVLKTETACIVIPFLFNAS